MGYCIADNIQKLLDSLQQEICRDTYNLTRDDHDAIILKIQQLKDFINELYSLKKPQKK